MQTLGLFDSTPRPERVNGRISLNLQPGAQMRYPGISNSL